MCPGHVIEIRLDTTPPEFVLVEGIMDRENVKLAKLGLVLNPDGSAVVNRTIGTFHLTEQTTQLITNKVKALLPDDNANMGFSTLVFVKIIDGADMTIPLAADGGAEVYDQAVIHMPGLMMFSHMGAVGDIHQDPRVFVSHPNTDN